MEVNNRKTSNIKVSSYGSALLTSQRWYTTFCPMNLRYFPFDIQTCEIRFAHGTRIGVEAPPVNQTVGLVFHLRHIFNKYLTKFLIKNEEWDLSDVRMDNASSILSLSDSKIIYPGFTISLELKRKPSFYMIILMLPNILVTAISVIGFLLPSEAGEKVSLQLTALLSYMLLFLLVADIIPPIGGNFPLIGQ